MASLELESTLTEQSLRGLIMQGMLLAAQDILNCIEEKNILQALFSFSPFITDIPISQSIRSRLSPATRLVITGHSLGGGIATILSLCLQKQYPNVCYAFDPPGQTITPKLNGYLGKTVVSTVMGDDLFPRFSTYTFKRLQLNIVSCLCWCKLSKFQLLCSLLPWNHSTLNSLFYTSKDLIPKEKTAYLQRWLQDVCTFDEFYDRLSFFSSLSLDQKFLG